MFYFKNIESLILKWVDPMQRAFTSAINFLRSRIGLREFAQDIAKGDIESAIGEVGLDEAAFYPMEVVLAQAMEDAGSNVSVSIPQGISTVGRKLKTIFNMRDPRVVQWLEANGAKMISRIIDDQRAMIRQIISSGISSGRKPAQIALDLVGRIDPVSGARTGGSLGLTANQEEWVASYRRDLETLASYSLKRALRDKRFDATIAKAIASGEPLPAGLIDKIVGRYRDNALRHRGEVVAQAEIKGAVHAAQIQAWEQAVSAGQVREDDVEKAWKSRDDAHVRNTHQHLNGQTVPLRQSFASLGGVSIDYPGDPDAPAEEVVGCRCRMLIRRRMRAYA